MGIRKPDAFVDHPLAFSPHPVRGVVEHVVDGDTLDLFVDAGFLHYPYIVGRLARVDAPEMNRLATREAGIAARDHLTVLTLHRAVKVRAAKDPDGFGRWIVEVEVFHPDTGVWFNVSDAMVAAGHAIYRTYGDAPRAAGR